MLLARVCNISTRVENMIAPYMWLTDARERANAEPNVMIPLNGLSTSHWGTRIYRNNNVPWGVATDFLLVQHFAHRWDKREITAEILDMYSEV